MTTRPTRSAPSRPEPGRPAGFTLLEVMVALVITGIVLATLSQGLRLGGRAQMYADRLDAGAGELEATARALRQLVAHATPGDLMAQTQAFVGGGHSMTFITALPDAPDGSATRDKDVTLQVSGDSLQLLWLPHYPRWITPRPPPSRVTLLHHVARLDISYASLGERWSSAWNGAALPALVRLQVVFPPDDGRHWPPIVAAPMRDPAQP